MLFAGQWVGAATRVLFDESIYFFWLNCAFIEQNKIPFGASNVLAMKSFDRYQRIQLRASCLALSEDFARRVVDTVDYADSNQFDKNKIRQDHFISKLGEEAVKIAFERLGKTVLGPDYTVYTAKQKTWEADLTIEQTPVAVKTQRKSAALRYGLSWSFQCSTHRKDPVLNDPEAWVVFVECDDLKNFECTVYPPFQIKELLFEDPVLPHLKGKKRVVYAEKLPIKDKQ